MVASNERCLTVRGMLISVNEVAVVVKGDALVDGNHSEVGWEGDVVQQLSEWDKGVRSVSGQRKPCDQMVRLKEESDSGAAV